MESSRPRIARARYVAAAAALLIAGSFAFAPVRAAAADLLRVFRVDKVQVVSLDPAELESIGKTLENGGHVDLEEFGDAWIDGDPNPRDVTLKEAQAAVDFPLRFPAGIEGRRTLQMQPAATYRFKLDVDAVNEQLRSFGAKKLLPAEVDGKVFSIELSPIVVANYETGAQAVGGDPSDPDDQAQLLGAYIVAGQGRSPKLVLPEGVDPRELRDVVLNLPFLPDTVRQRLAGITDWQNTLLIPNVNGSAKEVTIGSEQGVVMTEPDGAPEGGPQPAAVVWQQGGVVYGVSGDLDEARALKLARSMAE